MEMNRTADLTTAQARAMALLEEHGSAVLSTMTGMKVKWVSRKNVGTYAAVLARVGRQLVALGLAREEAGRLYLVEATPQPTPRPQSFPTGEQVAAALGAVKDMRAEDERKRKARVAARRARASR